jgi:CDP-6-deoxy-D-xylo-4-hexulose-3-dehydrase
LIDVDLPGMVPTVERVERAITERTKAVVLAHTLGYPFDTRGMRALCNKHGLWLVEDCCDALGSPGVMKYADLSTLSFYPAHQITTTEGGAVLYDDLALGKIVNSYRDWGRDCWCAPGHDNTCGIRFVGGQDHKYTYSHIGYHLAMTEFAGAMGAVQMDRLKEFVHARNNNHSRLHNEMLRLGMDKRFILPPGFEASWFGFALLCIPPINRDALTQYLEERGIQTRRMFGGNLTRQPAYQGVNMIIAEPLLNTDIVHDCGFWVGCWPGLSSEQLDAIVQSICEYVEGK